MLGGRTIRGWLLLCSLLLVVAVRAGTDAEGFVRLTPDEVAWDDQGGGIAVALIEGNPQQQGFYIQRVRFAPGIFSRPHFHPNDRFITVIRGTWWTGTGPLWNKDETVPLGPGSYMKHPAGAIHYDGAKGEETVVEIKGMGPAPIIYVDESGAPGGAPD